MAVAAGIGVEDGADHAEAFRAVACAVADFGFFFAEDHAVLRFPQVGHSGSFLRFPRSPTAALARWLVVWCWQGADALVWRCFGELVDALLDLIEEG